MLDSADEVLKRFASDEEDDEVIVLLPGETSLHFLQKIYRSPRQPIARRMRAAALALQHEHPKLGAIATTSLPAHDFAVMCAIARSGKAKALTPPEPE